MVGDKEGRDLGIIVQKKKRSWNQRRQEERLLLLPLLLLRCLVLTGGAALENNGAGGGDRCWRREWSSSLGLIHHYFLTRFSCIVCYLVAALLCETLLLF
jgi:hypothetical protein